MLRAAERERWMPLDLEALRETKVQSGGMKNCLRPRSCSAELQWQVMPVQTRAAGLFAEIDKLDAEVVRHFPRLEHQQLPAKACCCHHRYLACGQATAIWHDEALDERRSWLEKALT